MTPRQKFLIAIRWQWRPRVAAREIEDLWDYLQEWALKVGDAILGCFVILVLFPLGVLRRWIFDPVWLAFTARDDAMRKLEVIMARQSKS